MQNLNMVAASGSLKRGLIIFVFLMINFDFLIGECYGS